MTPCVGVLSGRAPIGEPALRSRSTRSYHRYSNLKSGTRAGCVVSYDQGRMRSVRIWRSVSDSPRAHVLRPLSPRVLNLALASAPPPSPSRYHVIRLLDEGGMAKLFLAHRLFEQQVQDLVVLKQV